MCIRDSQEEADAVPEAYLGAVAGTVRRCAKLLESLEDELHKPSAGQATDDAGRSETEASDGDDVALDDTPPRHLPEGVVYLRAAFDDVIEALSAAYGARERDWLENALERVWNDCKDALFALEGVPRRIRAT